MEMERLAIQNKYLAHHITKYLLRSDDHDPPLSLNHDVIDESGFKDAVVTLEKSCLVLKGSKEEEMERLVDTQLRTNYQKVLECLMVEDIQFGRIVSLFFFTYVLCKHLYQEGRQREVESVVDRLTAFLNDTISPWLIENHGGNWVSAVAVVNWLRDI